MMPSIRHTSWIVKPLILGLLVYVTVSQQSLQDSAAGSNIEIRVFNHNYRATTREVSASLQQAQLELRGFTKSIIKKTTITDSRKPVRLTLLHFFKKIPCNQLLAVEEEIRRALPGVWDIGVEERVNSTAARANLNGAKMCTAGLEVHLPPNRSCNTKRENREMNPCDDFCLFCFYGGSDY